MRTRRIWSKAGCWLAGTGLALLLSFSLAAAVENAACPEPVLPPLPAEAEVPFGEPVDGIALRLIVPAEVCPGQAIHLTVQVKNLSPRTRYLPEFFDSSDSQFALLEIKGPDGKLLRQSIRSELSVRPKAFKPLKPGEVWCTDIPDLQGEFFRDQFNFDAEPAITARVAAPIRQLDDADIETREEAMRQLSMAGPVALRPLQQAAQSGSDEVRDRARKIIAAADASEWLK